MKILQNVMIVRTLISIARKMELMLKIADLLIGESKVIFLTNYII